MNQFQLAAKLRQYAGTSGGWWPTDLLLEAARVIEASTVVPEDVPVAATVNEWELSPAGSMLPKPAWNVFTDTGVKVAYGGDQLLEYGDKRALAQLPSNNTLQWLAKSLSQRGIKLPDNLTTDEVLRACANIISEDGTVIKHMKAQAVASKAGDGARLSDLPPLEQYTKYEYVAQNAAVEADRANKHARTYGLQCYQAALDKLVYRAPEAWMQSKRELDQPKACQRYVMTTEWKEHLLNEDDPYSKEFALSHDIPLFALHASESEVLSAEGAPVAVSVKDDDTTKWACVGWRKERAIDWEESPSPANNIAVTAVFDALRAFLAQYSVAPVAPTRPSEPPGRQIKENGDPQ